MIHTSADFEYMESVLFHPVAVEAGIKAIKITPLLVLGLPVGFVNAVESKVELVKLDIPFIFNLGRKGGSNVAASVVNALFIVTMACPFTQSAAVSCIFPGSSTPWIQTKPLKW